MNRVLGVYCSRCGAICWGAVEEYDLREGAQTEGFETSCESCGCEFRFDVYVDVMNKEVL